MDNFDGIDVERENEISREYYNRGYYDGWIKETEKLTHYLCSLSDIELIQWKRNCIAMSKLTKDDFLAIATAIRDMAK